MCLDVCVITFLRVFVCVFVGNRREGGAMPHLIYGVNGLVASPLLFTRLERKMKSTTSSRTKRDLQCRGRRMGEIESHVIISHRRSTENFVCAQKTKMFRTIDICIRKLIRTRHIPSCSQEPSVYTVTDDSHLVCGKFPTRPFCRGTKSSLMSLEYPNHFV